MTRQNAIALPSLQLLSFPALVTKVDKICSFLSGFRLLLTAFQSADRFNSGDSEFFIKHLLFAKKVNIRRSDSDVNFCILNE